MPMDGSMGTSHAANPRRASTPVISAHLKASLVRSGSLWNPRVSQSHRLFVYRGTRSLYLSLLWVPFRLLFRVRLVHARDKLRFPLKQTTHHRLHHKYRSYLINTWIKQTQVYRSQTVRS